MKLMRKTSPQHFLSLWLMVAAFLALGCSDSSSPTTPGGPIIFSGTLNAQSNSSHDFEMSSDGLVRVRLTDLRLLLFDRIQADPNNLLVGFGIGQRDDAGECVLTSNFAATEGDLNVFRLSKGSYCMSMFDAGGLPEDAVLGYTIEAEFSF